jgi:microcystin-dependent protein
LSISRVKTWSAGETLTANDLNNEFNNITNNVLLEPFVATQQVDINGQLLLLDADGDTLLDGSTNNVVTMNVAGAADFRFEANNFTALSGSNITMASGDIVFTSGRVLQAKGADIASASTITVPTDGNSVTITGTTAITAFTTTQAGTLFYCRFTGTGLNITYNATSMITQWQRDYLTVPNEILAFFSLGSGNYTCWSMNGPKERVGVTIEANVSSAPAGYLAEDGTSYLRTTYPGLFAEIGTTFGSADGTHFNVPLTFGLAVINRDAANSIITSASTNGANAATLGGKGGAETHTLLASETPVLNIKNYTTAGGAITATAAIITNALTTQQTALVNTTGGGAHSNTPPWIAKAKFIRF